jgi:hypothetical protein
MVSTALGFVFVLTRKFAIPMLHPKILKHLILLVALGGSGCVGGQPMFLAIQDRYDLTPCADLVKTRADLAKVVQRMSADIAKAEAAPGGFLAVAVGYRSEYEQYRQLQAAAESAWRKNGCTEPKPK